MCFYQEEGKCYFNQKKVVNERTLVACIYYHLRFLHNKSEYLCLEPHVDIEYNKMFSDEKDQNVEKDICLANCSEDCPQHSLCARVIQEKIPRRDVQNNHQPNELDEKSFVPDLIIHSRNSKPGTNNGMIVEFKKENPTTDDSDYDKAKIKACTCQKGNFRYLIGAYVELLRGEAVVSLYSDGKEISTFRVDSCGARCTNVQDWNLDFFGEKYHGHFPGNRYECRRFPTKEDIIGLYEGNRDCINALVPEETTANLKDSLEVKKTRIFESVVLSGRCSWPRKKNRAVELSYSDSRRWGAAACGYRHPQSGYGREEATMISKFPSLLPYFETIDPETWFLLLQISPLLAQGREYENKHLSLNQWIQLLNQHPTLKSCFVRDCLEANDWADLLSARPLLSKDRTWESERWSSLWSRLLMEKPEFADRCNWKVFEGVDWANLLSTQPQFADKCNWSKLRGCDWANLLSAQPQFADKCNWSKLKGCDWVNLLSSQPQFSEYCNWHSPDSSDWEKLLSVQPHFARNLNSLVATEWTSSILSSILSKLPESSIYFTSQTFKSITAKDWVKILSAQPQLAGYCDWANFDGYDLSAILAARPEFESKCDWSKITTVLQWGVLLGKQPQFSKYCDLLEVKPDYDYDDSGDLWTTLLLTHPQEAPIWFAQRQKEWEERWMSEEQRKKSQEVVFFNDGGGKERAEHHQRESFSEEKESRYPPLGPYLFDLRTDNWLELLKEQPELARWVNWSELRNDELWIWHDEEGHASAKRKRREFWTQLLKVQPQFVAFCDTELTAPEWFAILKAQPSLISHCDFSSFVVQGDRYDYYNNYYERVEQGEFLNFWPVFLMAFPHFASYCNWESLRGKDWALLLSLQPQFANKCNWDVWRSFHFDGGCDGADWVKLLSSQPQFSDKCDWDSFDGADWARLLSAQPQFADKCNWHSLGGADWARLLSLQPQFANKCNWGSLDGAHWSWLLSLQPQFADKCKWDSLGGADWIRLLSSHPHFSVFCDWHKVGATDEWVKIRSKHSSFAEILDIENNLDKVTWALLDGYAWADLLTTHPHFSQYCNWDELNGENWMTLLKVQPRFADYCAWQKLYTIIFKEGHKERYDRLEVVEAVESICSYWGELLLSQPQLAKHCKVWDMPFAFDAWEWFQLLNIPEILDHLSLWPTLQYKEERVYVTHAPLPERHPAPERSEEEELYQSALDLDRDIRDWQSEWSEAYGAADPSDIIEY